MKPDTNLYNAYKIAGVLFKSRKKVTYLKKSRKNNDQNGMF